MAPTEDSHRKDSGRPAAPDLDAVAAAFPHLEVIELIGAGGMGAVFRARQPQLGRLVALKVIPATGRGASPAFADRFEREGRLLARLHHPNIVTIYDSGRAGDFFYLLMEHVDGVNLRQALRAGRFSPRDALTIVPRICEALQYAHDEGVLHRDVKPENILLDSRGRVKLADFGIGKWATGDGDGLAHEESTEPLAPTLTQAGVALGTPRYMAPEQAVDPQSVDHRADIYSLGVVFYELLTGELPPGEVVRPSDRAAVDGRIDAIVRQALQRERELRQRSAEEMKTQIESVGSTAPVAPRRKWRRLLSGLCFILAALIAVHFLIWIGLSLSAIALNLMPVEWAGLPVPWFIGLALFGLALGAVGWLLSADQGMAETPHDRIANPAARTKSLRNYFFGVFLTMMATAFVWFCVQMVIWWTQGSMEVASGAAWILFVFLAIAALGLTATGTIQMQVAQWSTPRRWAMTALGLTSAVLLVGVVWWIPRPYKSSKLAAAMESEARRQNDIARAAQSAARSAAVAAARARYDDVRQRYELGTVDQLELGRARHDLEVAEAGDDPLKRAEATASWAQEKENLIRQRFEAGMVTQSEVEQAAQDRIAANAALFEQRAASRTREAGVNEATVSLIQWIQGTWAADFQRSQREARIADHVQSDDERRRAQAMLEGFRATAQSGADGMTWTITETEIASHHPKTGDRRGPYSVVGATGNDSLEIESLDEGMIHRMLLVRDGDHLRLDRLDLPADPSPLHVPAYFVRVTSTQDKDP